MYVDTTPAIDAVGEMFNDDFAAGHLVPHLWFQLPVFRKANKKPHLLAIMIYADVIYWHRPAYEIDPATNLILAKRKKFPQNKFHKTYAQYAKGFGVSKGQVTEACDFLVKQNLLIREFVVETLPSGQTLGNVMTLEPIVATLKTALSNYNNPIPKKPDRGPGKTGEVSRKTPIAIPEKPETCIKNNRKNKREIITETKSERDLQPSPGNPSTARAARAPSSIDLFNYDPELVTATKRACGLSKDTAELREALDHLTSPDVQATPEELDAFAVHWDADEQHRKKELPLRLCFLVDDFATWVRIHRRKQEPAKKEKGRLADKLGFQWKTV